MIQLAALLASGPTTTAATAKKSSGSLLDPIAKPIAALLADIYHVVPNYGLAIIILSLLWMIIISPLTLKSTRSMLAMQKLQPQLKKLQEKHKNDRQAFAQAQMELFREHQVSPFGSCLPMLLPMPVFFALFRVIDGLSHTVKGASADCTSQIGGTVAVACPKYLSHSSRMWQDIHHAGGHINAFGMDLAKNAFSPHSSVMAALPFWLLLLLLAGTGYFQSAMMMSRNPAAANNPQAKMMKYLPVLFTVVFIRFPAGVLVYYAMSNVSRIAQQYLMYRYDPKVKALVAQEVEEIEAITHDIDEHGSGGRRPGGGTPTGRGPRPAPAGGPGAGATSGRSRFRDLLAAAAEQQQQKPKPKSGSGGGRSAPSASKPPERSAPRRPGPNGSGGSKTPPANGQTGQGNAGAGGGPKRASQGGRRTNRKRRGR